MNNDITDKLIQLIQHHKNRAFHGETLRKKSSPLELLNKINIKLSETGATEENLTKLIDQVVENSVQTDDAWFMNQMYGKQQPIAIIGDILTVLLNTSMYTYEVAPVMTLIEKECIKRLCSFVWKASDNSNDGVFTPGSSISNMIAMMMARNAKFPESRLDGLFENQRFSIFVSDQAHYSFLKGALFLGFGKDSIVNVKSDEDGKMDIFALNQSILKEKKKGNALLMLVGIAGTTFSGKYDNLQILGEIAREHNMWFHVDGAYGGSLLFSEKENNKLNGIALADSLSWSLHKIMGIPLVCAVLLTKKTGVLNESFAVSADYLFHHNDDFDLGQKSLQCGRRVDALKLWLAWKNEGDEGFEKRINALMKLSHQFADNIQEHNNMELLSPPESPIVCFRYSKKGLTLDESNILNKRIRDKIFDEGGLLFNYSTYNNRVYLRCVISDPNMTSSELEAIIDKIITTGNQLLGELPYTVKGTDNYTRSFNMQHQNFLKHQKAS